MRGEETLRAAKAAVSGRPPDLCLPVGAPPAALLRPVATAPGTLSATDIHALTEWRNRFVSSFLTEFVASEVRTEGWLTSSIGPDDTRILFMIDLPEGETIGYMGLARIDWDAGSAEADSVVRGGEAPKGLMATSLAVMWDWARTALGLQLLGVRVRSDNPAVAFYERVGFRELGRVPLRPVEEGGEVHWIEDRAWDAEAPSLVYMKLHDGICHGRS